MIELAEIRPGTYEDPDTGDVITISVSPYYSKVTTSNRDWYFIRESGEFDGTSVIMIKKGPFLVSVSSEQKNGANDQSTAGTKIK